MWSKQLFDIFIHFRVIQNWKHGLLLNNFFLGFSEMTLQLLRALRIIFGGTCPPASTEVMVNIVIIFLPAAQRHGQVVLKGMEDRQTDRDN